MILDEIVAHKKEEVAARIAVRPPAAVAAEAEQTPKRADFRNALTGLSRLPRAEPAPSSIEGPRGAGSRGPGLAFIAEIKGASPSAGEIRDGFDPVAVARAYESGGASALSVLTDARYFQGSWEALAAVCRVTKLPVLCKEFIVDPYQIDEARVAGASAVLLIAAIMNGVRLRQFLEHVRRRGLAALVEVHTPDEVALALDVGADIIGINNRDLKTLRVDLETTARLRPMIPPDVVVVSESGFEERQQVARLERLGVHAVLIGTSLMASPDPAAKLRELRGV